MVEKDIEGAIYMIRNYVTGDDEQTRIGDEYWLDKLPPKLKEAAFTILQELDDCNGAIRIYVRHHLQGKGWDDIETEVILWVKDFYDDWGPEEDKDDMIERTVADIKTGFYQLMD